MNAKLAKALRRTADNPRDYREGKKYLAALRGKELEAATAAVYALDAQLQRTGPNNRVNAERKKFDAEVNRQLAGQNAKFHAGKLEKTGNSPAVKAKILAIMAMALPLPPKPVIAV